MKFERRSRDYRRMYRDMAKDIANGVAHQKDISCEGLKLMQKKSKVHRDISLGVIERLYLKSPIKILASFLKFFSFFIFNFRVFSFFSFFFKFPCF